jgi:hypothetical protein
MEQLDYLCVNVRYRGIDIYMIFQTSIGCLYEKYFNCWCKRSKNLPPFKTWRCFFELSPWPFSPWTLESRTLQFMPKSLISKQLSGTLKFRDAMTCVPFILIYHGAKQFLGIIREEHCQMFWRIVFFFQERSNIYFE